MTYPEMNHETKTYWKEEDLRQLEMVNDFSGMFQVAKTILSRMPDNLGQVCGPISSGGCGSVEANLYHFNEQIKILQKTGNIIFDQMPFESTIHRLFQKEGLPHAHTAVLDEFYLPLFRSGKIATLYFMKDWETSKGATWEHQKAQELGIAIKYL